MIGYLQGRILSHSKGNLVLGIGAVDAGGIIGYDLSVPQSPTYLELLVGETLSLFVYTHVRENAIDLFGFLSHDERELFLTLMSVNGIGPKAAMGILSHAEVPMLVRAILAGDKDFLVQIPGIGKKTSERVIVELVDPVRKKVEAGFWRGASDQLFRSGPVGSKKDTDPLETVAVSEAREALISLGYREYEAAELLKKATVGRDGNMKTEELIKAALRQTG